MALAYSCSLRRAEPVVLLIKPFRTICYKVGGSVSCGVRCLYLQHLDIYSRTILGLNIPRKEFPIAEIKPPSRRGAVSEKAISKL